MLRQGRLSVHKQDCCRKNTAAVQCKDLRVEIEKQSIRGVQVFIERKHERAIIICATPSAHCSFSI